MTKYPFDKHTRVALVESIADLSAPRLHEIGVVVGDIYEDPYTEENDVYGGAWSWVNDITCDLTPDGLQVSPSDATTNSSPWAGDLDSQRPTRVGYPGAALKAYRHRPPDNGLWDRAVYKAQRVLVVRRGVLVDEPWDIGDNVEVYQARLGKRSTIQSARNTNTMFVLPLYISAANDDATVVL